MSNVLPREQQIEVLHHLVEGNTLRSTARLTGVHRTTIMRLMVDFGRKCKAFMDQQFRNLTLAHVEVDEIWTFVEKKQGRLTPEEKQDRFDIGDVYLWTALDQETKLVPSFVVGKRSADNARRLMVDLSHRLTMPKPHQSDPHRYQSGGYLRITQISSDGFSAYPEAVDLAFGPYVKYGQIIKDYRNADQPGRYAPPEMVGTERKGIFGIREDEERSICTSHVERHNLTHPDEAVHPVVAGLLEEAGEPGSRLRDVPCLLQLRVAGTRDVEEGRNRLPAAMAAGVVRNLWSFENLFDAVMGAPQARLAA